MTMSVKNVLTNLEIKEDIDWLKIAKTQFPQPNDYFHLFVNNKLEFEQYLKFLIDMSKKTPLPNEQAIYHNMFEYYIQEYDDFYQKNKETLQYRDEPEEYLENIEKQVLRLLTDPENEEGNKYDKAQVLMLFKMHHFDPGIIYLCEKL